MLRILNSPAAWGITITAVFVYFLFVATAPAQATRPLPMQPGDKCWNLPHIQDRTDFSLGAVRWKVKTGEKGDCRYVNYLRIR